MYAEKELCAAIIVGCRGGSAERGGLETNEIKLNYRRQTLD